MVRALGDRSARVLLGHGSAATAVRRQRRLPARGPRTAAAGGRSAPRAGRSAGYDRTLIADTGVVATSPPRWSWRSTTAGSSSTCARPCSGSTRPPARSARHGGASSSPPTRSADASRATSTTVRSSGSCSRASRSSGSAAARRILSSCGPWRRGSASRSGRCSTTCGRLVQGIMPTTLQELGLRGRSRRARRPDADAGARRVAEPLGRMDAEVESTGYFVVAEALTNALKHAAAQQITVELAAKDGRLEIIVTDDGNGPGRRRPPGSDCAACRTGSPPWTGRSTAAAGSRPRDDVAGGVRMRLIIAEDDVLLREGIARILGDEGYEIVAQAGDRDDLLDKVRTHHPDVVVTDIRMPPTFTRDGHRGRAADPARAAGHRDHRAVAAHRHPRRAGAADARRRPASATC